MPHYVVATFDFEATVSAMILRCVDENTASAVKRRIKRETRIISPPDGWKVLSYGTVRGVMKAMKSTLRQYDIDSDDNKHEAALRSWLTTTTDVLEDEFLLSVLRYARRPWSFILVEPPVY